MAKQNNKTNKSGSKGNYKYYRNKRKTIDVEDNKVKTGHKPNVLTEGEEDNDYSWYTHIYPAAEDVASVPFNVPVGTKFNPLSRNMYGGIVVQNTPTGTAETVPGIMSFKIVPTVGGAIDNVSPVNIASQQIYTLDRKANSGATNYDKSDVMLTILGMDSGYMLFETFVRLYREIGTYNYMNRYMPEALVSAQGFDYKSFASNMADFRGTLNLFAYQLGSINVPDQFDFIRRHSWMFTNIYKDDNLTKAQLYQYVLAGVYVFEEAAEKPAQLTFKTLQQLAGVDDNELITYDKVSTMINAIMQPLLGSQDVGTISGDLAKAFGENGMIKIQTIGESDGIAPVYSSEVLLQMSNMEMSYLKFDDSSLNITVNHTDLVTGPYIVQKIGYDSSSPSLYSFVKHFLNMPVDNPSYKEVMVATRMMVVSEYDQETNRVEYVSHGTELCTDCIITQYQKGKIVHQNTLNVISALNNNPTAWIERVDQIIAFSKFDWAPTLHVFGQSGETQYDYLGHIQNDANYTFLEDATLKSINDLAVMSEFAAKDYPSNN